MTIEPKPADVALLRRGSKGLLLVFGDAHERQPHPVKFIVRPNTARAVTTRLGPAEGGALELELSGR